MAVFDFIGQIKWFQRNAAYEVSLAQNATLGGGPLATRSRCPCHGAAFLHLETEQIRKLSSCRAAT